MKRLLESMLAVIVVATAWGFAAASTAGTERAADRILGVYLAPDARGKVEIFRRAEKYYGRIVWRAEPGRDVHNPDPALRDRDLVGVEFLRGFEFDGEDAWVNGEIYSPRDGDTYRGRIWLESEDTLKLRGYLGVSLFGQTVSFERIE